MDKRLFQFSPIQPSPKKGGDPMYHQQLELSSQDVIRIYNPLDEPFIYKWDGIPRRLQPHQQKDVLRFLANKFLDDITEHEVNKDYYAAGEEELSKLAKRQIEYINAKERNEKVWMNFRNTYLSQQYRDQKKAEMAEKCILGVVSFYNEQIGLDESIVDERGRTSDEIIQERLNTPINEDQVSELPVIKPNRPMPINKQKLAEEATV